MYEWETPLMIKKWITRVFATKKKENPESFSRKKYMTLSPTKDADISGYKEALDFVFSNKDIKNVAISGAYCSGKSSIIDTYEEINKNKLRILHISLAHFSAIDQFDFDKKKVSGKYRATIESKIVNQLIQQIPSKRIRRTKFRIKKNSGGEKALGLSALLCAFLALLVYMIKFNSWKTIHGTLEIESVKNFLNFTTATESRIVSAFLLLTILGYVIFKLVYAQYTNSFIRKISFQGNEIEIGNESKNSFFDKYLNEVLYIFEEADAHAIVFEDIDRFNDIALFERLREINTLVNIRKSQKCKEPLRFIYMMRDDLFIEFKDRTKFFDFIIPVIPIVDGSNSYNQLNKYLYEAEILQYFDTTFLFEISVFIDDYRILKNITNELLLYREKLASSGLDLNKLLAAITYKNIFPFDYDELRFRRGGIHNFLSSEAKIREHIKSPHIKQLEKIQNDLEQKELEIKTRIEALNNKTNEQNEIKPNCYLSYDFENGKWSGNAKTNPEYVALNNQLKAIQKEINDDDNMPFNELVSKYSEIVFEPEFLIDSINVPAEIVYNQYFGLLKYLLSSGNIDESHSDYVTYDIGLTISDKSFIRSVFERHGQEYAYKIDSPLLVVESIKPKYFSQPATLNFDLYDCVYENNLIEQIRYSMILFDSPHRKKYIDFIKGYMHSGKNFETFFNNLIVVWNNVFDCACDSFTNDELKQLCCLILKNSDKDKLYLVQHNNKLGMFISKTPEILLEQIEIQQLFNVLRLLRVRFKEIDFEKVDTEVLKNVYENDLYELNASNIIMMLETYCEVKDLSKTFKSLFSFVYSNEEEYPFCDYAAHNINEILPVYLKIYAGEIEDDLDTISRIIYESYDDEALNEYLSRQTIKIPTIDENIDASVFSLLLKHNLVELNADNLLFFFKYYGYVAEELVQFINSNENNIMAELKSTEDQVNLLKILAFEGVSDDKLIQFVKDLGEDAFAVIKLAKILLPKMRLIIDADVLDYSPELATYIRDYYPDLLETYICKNIDVYFNAKLNKAEQRDFSLAMSSQLISEQKKTELISKHKGGILLIYDKYPDAVLEYALKGRVNQINLEWIIKKYSSLSDDFKNRVPNLIINDPSFCFRYINYFDKDLKFKLMSIKELDINYKVLLLLYEPNDLTKEELCEYLIAMGAEKIADNINGGHQKVPVNSFNEYILYYLKKEGIIREYIKTASGVYYRRIQLVEQSKLKPRT